MYCSTVSTIVSTTSSFEYSWLENKLKSGDLNSSRLNVLECLLDDQNSRFGSLKGTVNWGLWYSKNYAIALTAFADADHAEQVENGFVELYFVRTEFQLADIFTKALCRERIEFLIDKLKMRSFTPKTLKELADEAEE
ncbi:hypothetical protein Tco_0845039 [Tanacetum coccineum]